MAVGQVMHGDLKAVLPDTSGTLRLKGLEGPVQVYRDRYGIPHARAGSVHDAFFTQGFVTAQDRLWQMEYDRRRATGRWAEYAGKGALEQDVAMRRFQLGPSARRDYAAVNAETQAMLDAYAAGVNAFVAASAVLPVEYALVGGAPEPWEPWDCLVIFKVRHILMGTFEGKLWRARLLRELGPEKAARILPGYQPGHLVIIPPGGVYDGSSADALEELRQSLQAINWMDVPDSGSNNWVLAGSRTASGKPLLAGDPHRPLDTPNVYYQNHIACPEFDVVGLSFPGVPGFPHFGHNAHVAWCVTHAMADYQDLYVERFEKGGATRYESADGWKTAEVRHERVQVSGGEPMEFDVTVTLHGPIIAGDPGKGYGVAFRYTATDGPNHGAEAFLPMLRAPTAGVLEEAMRLWVDPCNNFLFADVHGDIGYLTRGSIPLRPMANAWLPVPGWASEFEWRGSIPFEELPRSRNPEAGYIVTANNRITAAEYPYHINLDFAPEFRARRIIARLDVLQKATVADMAAIHGERLSIPNQAYARLLASVPVTNGLVAQAQARLAAWEGAMEHTSVEPTIISAFRVHLDRLVVRPLLGPLADEAFSATGRGGPAHMGRLSTLLLQTIQDGASWMLPPGATLESVLAKALEESVAYLQDRLGNDMDAWTWGAVHATRPRHTISAAFPELAPLLDPPSVPMGGGGETPQAAGFSPADLFTVTGLSVARYVFDLGDWDGSRWVIPLGASGHPGSPHYADQAPVWGEVQLIPMLYSWSRIEADVEAQQALWPG